MLDFYEVLLRLLCATILGAVIGINRGRLEWAAGMRTHMLVSLGAALAVIVSAYGFQQALNYPHVVLDPSRVAAQVISGIGFLGAGTILFIERDQIVRGLTTAAGLWAVASVGLASGAGLFVPAITATIILWVILALLKPLERRLARPRKATSALVLEVNSNHALTALEQALGSRQAPIRQLHLRRAADGSDTIEISFSQALDDVRLSELADACRHVAGVSSVLVTFHSGRQG